MNISLKCRYDLSEGKNTTAVKQYLYSRINPDINSQYTMNNENFTKIVNRHDYTSQ